MLVISQYDKNAVKLAREFLLAGKIIAIPTDTVYGLAVDATNFQAVKKLFIVKKRDEKKPIAIFLKNKMQIKNLFGKCELLNKLVDKYLPGKLTIVAKLNSNPKITLAKNLNLENQQYLGFRMVDSYFIKKLFKGFNLILAVSSANISNQKVFNNAKEIANSSLKIDLVISGEVLNNLPSTIVKIEDQQIKIIRQGEISILL